MIKIPPTIKLLIDRDFMAVDEEMFKSSEKNSSLKYFSNMVLFFEDEEYVQTLDSSVSIDDKNKYDEPKKFNFNFSRERDVK